MNSLEKAVLRQIGESVSSPDVFTDDDVGIAPIRDSLNEGIAEIAMLTGGQVETFHLPLRKEVQHYTLQLDNGAFGWVLDAWIWDNKRPLDVVTVKDLEVDPRWMTDDGVTRCVFQLGTDVLGVYPRPTASSDVIELRAAIIPGEYQRDTDRIGLREEFRRALVNYAAAEYWASRGDANSARDQFALYSEALGTRLTTMETNDRVYAFGRNHSVETLPTRPGR